MKPNLDGWPYCLTWKLYCAEPCRYILRAYQSPCSGTHCADQCAQIPNLASRNHSGHVYPAVSDSQVGWNGPVAIEGLGETPCRRTGAAPRATADVLRNSRRDRRDVLISHAFRLDLLPCRAG